LLFKSLSVRFDEERLMGVICFRDIIFNPFLFGFNPFICILAHLKHLNPSVMRYASLTAYALLLLYITGCKKEPDNCEEIRNIKIAAIKDTFFVGEDIDLGPVELATVALYIWWHGENPNAINSSDPYVHISSCSKADEGWYYLSVSHPDCSSIVDSVYVTVINKPAQAPCSPAVNSANFSSMPNVNFGSVVYERDPSYNRKSIKGRAAFGYPDIAIYFNNYWDNKEPEDGEYTLEGFPALSDFKPYTAYLSSRYSDILFSGSGKLYVSHINGKLQVQFCDINLLGEYGGIAFRSTATGALKAP
jgi:hypothetical protein